MKLDGFPQKLASQTSQIASDFKSRDFKSRDADFKSLAMQDREGYKSCDQVGCARSRLDHGFQIQVPKLSKMTNSCKLGKCKLGNLDKALGPVPGPRNVEKIAQNRVLAPLGLITLV